MDYSGSIAADAMGNHPATYVGATEHAARSALSDGGSTFFHHQFPDPTVAQLADPIVLDGDFTIEVWTLMCHYTDDGDPIVGGVGSDISLKFAVSALAIGVTMVSCKPAADAMRPASASTNPARGEKQAADAFARAQAEYGKGHLTGALTAWIEIGSPDAGRLHKGRRRRASRCTPTRIRRCSCARW